MFTLTIHLAILLSYCVIFDYLYFLGEVPDDLLERLIKEFRDAEIRRILADFEDIRDAIRELSNSMLDVLTTQILDSTVENSCFLNTKEFCTSSPTVLCYLSSIFNQNSIDTRALNFIPDRIGNSLLRPEIISKLWPNENGGGLKFGDCLKSFFETLITSSSCSCSC